MLAVRVGRNSRVLVGASAVGICLAGIVPTLTWAAADAATDRFAARLLRLDPGGRIGGNTQVTTAPGATLTAAPGRVNFIIGLGRNQTIMGGPGHDQLGARADGAIVRGGGGNDLIHGHRGHQTLVGGRGHDHIFGGPGRDRLHGGAGNDILVDRQGATVVITGPGLNRVDVADGDGDERVVCSPNSVNRIRVDRGDRLHPRCRRASSSIVYGRPARAARARVAQNQAVTGAGTHDSPYTAACDNESADPCVISAFASRSLSGLWANEYVPAYKCPTSHPYLYANNYAPAGSKILGGVEVTGLGAVGVSITGFFSVDLTNDFRITGPDTGWPNSSATNWTTGTNAYQVKLHCTKQESLGFGGPR